MVNRKIEKLLSGLVILMVSVGLALNCEKKEEGAAAAADKTKAVVVVYVTGDARVLRSGNSQEEAASVGMILNEADQIKTTSGTVDLQTRGGSAVRVQEFTTITLKQLVGESGGKTQVDMKHGGLLASVKKGAAREDFSVVTPTAIAGVRGTRFSVEVEDGQKSRVRVIEGKVALAPRVAGLENYTEEEIKSSESLQKAAKLEEQEVVLEANDEGSLNANVEKKLLKLSAALEQAKAADKKPEQAAGVAAVEETIAELETEKSVAVKKEEVEISREEIMNHQTLIIVDDTLVASVVEDVDATNPSVAQKADIEKIQQERKQKEEIILKRVEQEASKRTFSSEEEIKKHYNRMEMVILKNKEEIKGAVIAQTNDQMVIHTADGVRRVKKTDVATQDFLY